MAFTGTLDKCKACNKTVYVVDMMSLEGVPYHKSCFKCSHCKGTLSMSSYSWMDGVLYCKPHFEQLFKESGNFSKNFQTAKSSERQNDQLARAPSKLSSLFSGTQDKCATCSKTVYPLEKVSLEGECYHKSCFRCAHGGCPLTHSSYAALDGVLYCKHHFQQLFMEKGNYSHVLKAAANKKNATPPPETADQSS
ncbi:LIM domain-containing protein PLIM2b [Morus notabilis]|uniref:LIM domain-containing protein PLIM2b n=1 Tax=Morus notabilis TaxID=981085 RepID=UPI000CED7528|nr:LIM domain-containing protein PLIM2b [Morus notabilis]